MASYDVAITIYQSLEGGALGAFAAARGRVAVDIFAAAADAV